MTSAEVLTAAAGRTSKSGIPEITRIKPPLVLRHKTNGAPALAVAIVTAGEDDGNFRADGTDHWLKAADYNLA
jgi:hypothetical protein